MNTQPSRALRSVTWISRALAVILLAWVFVPDVQALSRPNVTATSEMQEASRNLDLTEASLETPETPGDPQTCREQMLAYAYSLLGTPYKWGAKGPDAYDCSGFTTAVYASAGVALPDGSFNQAEGELPLSSLGQLAPGDLLFYRWPGDTGIGHVTIYAGEGWAIGTGSPGQQPHVVVYPLASDLLVSGVIITYRHIELPDER